MQNTNDASIALESLKKLDELSNRAWAAYPLSLLDHPKEKIQRAILAYMKTEGKDLIKLNREVIAYQYAMLAYFIPDQDAALLNSMAVRNKTTKMMQDTDDMETIVLPQKLHNTTIFKHYHEVANRIVAENIQMRNEAREVLGL